MFNATWRVRPFFYGWVIVSANFLILGAGWGIGQGTFGVFVSPMSEDSDWSRASISLMYSISMLVSFTFGAFWGWLSDRWSVRGVIAIAGILTGVGIFSSSFSQSLWQLYILYGLIAGSGMGGTTGALSGLASRWFDDKRGLALGIGFAGSAAGGATIPLLAEYLISNGDWRFAFRILSFIVWGAFLLGVILIKEPVRSKVKVNSSLEPESPLQSSNLTCDASHTNKPASVSLSKALKTKQFWTLFSMVVMPELLLTMILVHLVPAAIDAGISSITAATLLTVFGISKMVGMLGGGALGDRTGHRKIYIISMALQGAALLWLTTGSEIWVFYVFAIAFGLSNGGWSPQFPAIAAKLFGMRHIGAIIGAVLTGAGIGGLIGPVLAGYIFDTMGQYQIAFFAGAGVAVLGVCLALLLKSSPRQRQSF